MIVRIALSTFLVLLLPGLAAAASCANLTPAGGPIGYRARNAPDRCEGLYQSPVAGESVELLSFVRRPIAFDPRIDKSLTITAPEFGGSAEQALRGKPITVIGRAMPLGVYYRLDEQIAPGASLAWPIADVVVPAGLAPGDLGVLGIVQGSNGPLFIPLDVVAARPPAISGGPVMTFRAPTDLDSLQWKLYAEGTRADWKQAVPGRMLRAGEPIRITLEAPPGSVLTLEIAAKPVGSDYVRTRMQILLP